MKKITVLALSMSVFVATSFFIVRANPNAQDNVIVIEQTHKKPGVPGEAKFETGSFHISSGWQDSEQAAENAFDRKCAAKEDSLQKLNGKDRLIGVDCGKQETTSRTRQSETQWKSESSDGTYKVVVGCRP